MVWDGVLNYGKRHHGVRQYPKNYGNADDTRFCDDAIRFQSAIDLYAGYAESERIQCGLSQFSPLFSGVIEEVKCQTPRSVIPNHPGESPRNRVKTEEPAP